MAFDPNKITFFARTDARGKNVQFGIKAKDRQRHVYVIGKTGMGKSTLLENMAVQDIQNGEGMAFIDPHGSAAETLLNYIPEHRIKDVLYFAPFDTDHPVAFNIMEDVGPDKRHLVVSGLMSVFKKIWVDAWSARMEYILSNTLLALLEYPGSTLLGVNRMLSDKDYRKLVVDNVKDPGVRSFWVDEFAKYNERYMQEAGDAIKNKIGQFTSNPIIRNIVGQEKSSFDIRHMMDEQKILIINLSKGLIGESNANLLGSMLTTRIYLAAMSRADLSPEKMRDMPNFYFYVDEFQSFANATFANILSEARKYHLNLTIAHQYIEQMEEEVRSAVFGNVGTIISFRVGPFDAEVLETIFTPQFLAADIVNLGAYQLYLTLMIDGIGSQPFSATTLPPIAPPTISYRDVAIASSREQFTHARSEVEEGIHKFHEPVIAPKRIERTERGEKYEKSDKPKPRTFEERPRSTPRESREPRRVVERVAEEETVAPVEEPTIAVVDIPPSTFEEREDVRPSPEHPKVYTRTDRPQSTPEHRKQPHPRREQKVEDLRSVLKRIATPPPSEKNDPTILPKKKDVGDKTDLKAALSAILKTQPQESESAAPVAQVEEKTEPHTPTPRAEEKYTPQPPSEVKEKIVSPAPEKKDTMPSPKELERMMRVTTSDNSKF